MQNKTHTGKTDAENKTSSMATIVVSTALCLVPIIFGIALWQKLPDKIPMNYDIHGNAGTLAPKWVTVFLVPLYCAAINCVACVLLYKNKKSVNSMLFYAVIFFVPLLSILIETLFFIKQFGIDAPVHKIIPALMSAFFVLIGNYFPKISRNKVIGIRVPWTLKSDDVWQKTHRLGGILWVVFGFISFAFSFTRINYVVFFISLAVMTIVPVVYSAHVYTTFTKNAAAQ